MSIQNINSRFVDEETLQDPGYDHQLSDSDDENQQAPKQEEPTVDYCTVGASAM